MALGEGGRGSRGHQLAAVDVSVAGGRSAGGGRRGATGRRLLLLTLPEGHQTETIHPIGHVLERLAGQQVELVAGSDLLAGRVGVIKSVRMAVSLLAMTFNWLEWTTIFRPAHH